jgi:hypothetical protein
MRHVLNEDVRQAIFKISRLFGRLCSRKVQIANRDTDVTEAAMSVCMLEKLFLPTFMNIMSHLPIHLVEELFLCGPVHTR